MGNEATILSIETPALVCLGGEYLYLLATDGELILDYGAADPDYRDSPGEPRFREGLLQVRPIDGPAFVSALRKRIWSGDDLAEVIEANGVERSRPAVLIDFDRAWFVSAVFDTALETYAGDGWHARFGDPLEHVPSAIAIRWTSPR